VVTPSFLCTATDDPGSIPVFLLLQVRYSRRAKRRQYLDGTPDIDATANVFVTTLQFYFCLRLPVGTQVLTQLSVWYVLSSLPWMMSVKIFLHSMIFFPQHCTATNFLSTGIIGLDYASVYDTC